MSTHRDYSDTVVIPYRQDPNDGVARLDILEDMRTELPQAIMDVLDRYTASFIGSVDMPPQNIRITNDRQIVHQPSTSLAFQLQQEVKKIMAPLSDALLEGNDLEVSRIHTVLERHMNMSAQATIHDVSDPQSHRQSHSFNALAQEVFVHALERAARKELDRANELAAKQAEGTKLSPVEEQKLLIDGDRKALSNLASMDERILLPKISRELIDSLPKRADAQTRSGFADRFGKPSSEHAVATAGLV